MLVGAPYDGPDHRGAIYVYLGSSIRRTNANKIEWKYAQVRTKYVEMEPFRDKYIARYCEDKTLMHYSNFIENTWERRRFWYSYFWMVFEWRNGLGWKQIS